MKARKANQYSFEDFLRKKIKDDGPRIDWERRRMEWYKSVDQFYEKILRWLGPFVDKSLLKIDGKDIEIYEDYLGTYKIRRMDIFLGQTRISLEPQGTMIYGALGRVDLRGPKGELLIVEEEWNKWYVTTWKSHSKMWDLTKESFLQSFQLVTSGE